MALLSPSAALHSLVFAAWQILMTMVSTHFGRLSIRIMVALQTKHRQRFLCLWSFFGGWIEPICCYVTNNNCALVVVHRARQNKTEGVGLHLRSGANQL